MQQCEKCEDAVCTSFNVLTIASLSGFKEKKKLSRKAGDQIDVTELMHFHTPMC